ncbi:hypothetical protein [Idiomarina xiamenensis]|uniref:hypothetical protein n=1 Tax=Idiomarina xiamenensis TaxID=1207041 RepID=UPI0002DC6EB3|nr:hypothetical protein [Idiomarina xiamenensis]
MLSEFDSHAFLVSSSDTWFFEGDEEEAADRINYMLHLIAEYSQEDDTQEQLEEVVRRTLYDWIEQPALLDLDYSDMQEYISSSLLAVREQEDDTDDQ